MVPKQTSKKKKNPRPQIQKQPNKIPANRRAPQKPAKTQKTYQVFCTTLAVNQPHTGIDTFFSPTQQRTLSNQTKTILSLCSCPCHSTAKDWDFHVTVILYSDFANFSRTHSTLREQSNLSNHKSCKQEQMTKVLECHLDTLAPPAWNKKSVMEILLQHSTEQTGLYNIPIQGISGYSLPERKRGLIATSLVVTAHPKSPV